MQDSESMKKAKELYDRARVSLVSFFSWFPPPQGRYRSRPPCLQMALDLLRTVLGAEDLRRQAGEREEL